ncbi:hypothetical protein D9M72_327560 [compost metagenome]
MTFVDQLQHYFFIPIALGGSVILIGYSGRMLASRHSSDVRIVWYLFSLTVTVTFMIAWWAGSAGAIDASGSFRGAAGTMLLKLLKSTLDIKTAFVVYGCVVGLVVIPQFASWALSGVLHGCASAPIFIGPAFRFLFWSVVKSLVVVAGVILPTSVYGWFSGWDGMNAIQLMDHAFIALTSLVLAFAMLCVYRDVYDALAPVGKSSPNDAGLRRIILRINTWMSRRIISPEAPTP